MLEIALCCTCSETRSRLSAASAMLQSNLRVVTLDALDTVKLSKKAWVIADGDLETIRSVVFRLQSRGVETNHRVIRIIDQAWETYFYNDLPVFATLVKPQDPLAASEILHRLSNTTPLSLQVQRGAEQRELQPLADEFVQSQAMQHTLSQLQCIERVRVDTVLLGPTGAGKDTIAHWLHDQSALTGPFVHVNCAALPEQLFESELFGVKAGAYTGVTQDRPGRLLMADQGTLYLDEIDSLPLACQAKLLTALQYRGATPLGGTVPYNSDFRLIVSTKTDFTELVEKGDFREDLYYRLNICKIRIPPLYERKEDIIPLYEFFLKEASKELKKPFPELIMEDEALLIANAWPGNVRELRAHAYRTVLGLEAANPDEKAAEPFSLKRAVGDFERVMLERSLKRHGGSVKKVAQELGSQPQTIYNKVKLFGIEKMVGRSEA